MSANHEATIASIDAVIAALEPDAVALRRDLHTHPELSWNEHRTQATIAAWLAQRGLSTSQVAGTGLWGDVGVGETTWVYRADIDALPIDDAKTALGVPWASHNAGVCHACGHDAHTAVGALVAAAFAQVQPSSARWRFVFQPAEEVIPSGGEQIVASGILDGAAGALALHVDPMRDVGTVGVRAGAITASTDAYRIRVVGRSGHSARPHLAADAILGAAEVIRALYMVVGQRVDPLQAAVLNAGIVRGGDARNVIAPEATIEGVARALDAGVRELLRAEIVRAAESAAAVVGCRAEVSFSLGTPSVFNDAGLLPVVERAAADVVGTAAVHPMLQPSTGAEDFGFYGSRTRTFMLRLGVRTPGAATTHLHTPGFDIDERAIGIGARIMARALLGAATEKSS